MIATVNKEKVFQIFKIELTIHTEDELLELFHRVNVKNEDFEKSGLFTVGVCEPKKKDNLHDLKRVLLKELPEKCK